MMFWLVIPLLLVQCKSQQTPRHVVDVENMHWKLVEVSGKTVSTPEGGREVYMVLSREGDTRKLVGYAGCNGLGGDYAIDGSTIKFQPITTRMHCQLQMEVENTFTQMLSRADSFRIHDNILELYADKELLGKFEAQPGR